MSDEQSIFICRQFCKTGEAARHERLILGEGLSACPTPTRWVEIVVESSRQETGDRMETKHAPSFRILDERNMIEANMLWEIAQLREVHV